MNTYKVGDIIKVKVIGIENYGIFVKADNNYSGLIHISEIDNTFIQNIKDYANINDIIYVNVIGVDKQSKHLKLSIKNINYTNNQNTKVRESISGFLPLYNVLDNWIEKKISEIKKEND